MIWCKSPLYCVLGLQTDFSSVSVRGCVQSQSSSNQYQHQQLCVICVFDA